MASWAPCGVREGKVARGWNGSGRSARARSERIVRAGFSVWSERSVRVGFGAWSKMTPMHVRGERYSATGLIGVSSGQFKSLVGCTVH
jgi:hypothetical protein